MDKNNFFKKDALRPTDEQRLLTKPFYRNSNVLYAHFDEWKDIDRFYFIPLYLEMTYCVAGIGTELAPAPVWLGSFIKTTINHPELFQFHCPKCGRPVFPYRYAGSPLSGRVDLEGYVGILAGCFFHLGREFTIFSCNFSLCNCLAQARISFASTKDLSHV